MIVTSNHTDRELEAVSVGTSKQVYDKVLDDIFIKGPMLKRELTKGYYMTMLPDRS